MNRVVFLLIGLVVAFAITGQVLMKRGMGQIGIITLEHAAKILQIATNGSVLAGLFLMGVGALIWLIVLSQADLSYALPLFGGLAYLLIPLISWLFLGEPITLVRWLGISLIAGGMYLASR
jgi:multidrug transporter EmrE-like cation transporter